MTIRAYCVVFVILLATASRFNVVHGASGSDANAAVHLNLRGHPGVEHQQTGPSSYPFFDFYHSILSNDQLPHHIYDDNYVNFQYSDLDAPMPSNSVDASNKHFICVPLNSSPRVTQTLHENKNYAYDASSPESTRSSSETFNPDDFIQDYDHLTESQEKKSNPVKHNRDTPYWQSLKSNAKKKIELIDKYTSMTMINGRPISRNTAGIRLRGRCTKKIANDLLCDDPIRVQRAKIFIDDGVRWSGSILTPSDRSKLRDILVKHYNVGTRIAPGMVTRGFKELPVAAKMEYASSTKDAKILSHLARKVQDAYEKYRRRRWTKSDGPVGEEDDVNDCEDDHEVQDGNFVDPPPRKLKQCYWTSLSNAQQELILQRYSSLTGKTIDDAWCKLQAQCTKKVADLLLSEEVGAHHWAIAMLQKVYRRRGDLLTQEERKRVYEQLDDMFGVKGRNASRAVQIGTRHLDEEGKAKVREDVSMKNDRFEKLAQMVWDETRAYERARYLNKKQAE